MEKYIIEIMTKRDIEFDLSDTSIVVEKIKITNFWNKIAESLNIIFNNSEYDLTELKDRYFDFLSDTKMLLHDIGCIRLRKVVEDTEEKESFHILKMSEEIFDAIFDFLVGKVINRENHYNEDIPSMDLFIRDVKRVINDLNDLYDLIKQVQLSDWNLLSNEFKEDKYSKGFILAKSLQLCRDETLQKYVLDYNQPMISCRLLNVKNQKWYEQETRDILFTYKLETSSLLCMSLEDATSYVDLGIHFKDTLEAILLFLDRLMLPFIPERLGMVYNKIAPAYKQDLVSLYTDNEILLTKDAKVTSILITKKVLKCLKEDKWYKDIIAVSKLYKIPIYLLKNDNIEIISIEEICN